MGSLSAWDFINQHTNHATLLWAEKVVIEALHFCCHVDWQDIKVTCLGYCISNSGIDEMSMLWSCFRIIISIDIHWSVMITRQWSSTTHVSACESNSILVLITTVIVWVLKWSVCTLAQITLSTSISTQQLLMSLFDDHESQLGFSCFATNAWQVTTGFPLFLSHFGLQESLPPFSWHYPPQDENLSQAWPREQQL